MLAHTDLIEDNIEAGVNGYLSNLFPHIEFARDVDMTEECRYVGIAKPMNERIEYLINSLRDLGLSRSDENEDHLREIQEIQDIIDSLDNGDN